MSKTNLHSRFILIFASGSNWTILITFKMSSFVVKIYRIILVDLLIKKKKTAMCALNFTVSVTLIRENTVKGKYSTVA